MPSPYVWRFCDTLRVRRRRPQTSYNSGWTRVPYLRCLGGDRRLSIDPLCRCGSGRRGGMLAGKGRNDDSPTIPWVADTVVTTGDLVVAGSNAVEANAGQCPLVQELQTALPPAAHRSRCRPHHPRPRSRPPRTPRRSPRRLRRRALRDLPATLAMDRRQKLLRLIAKRRVRTL